MRVCEKRNWLTFNTGNMYCATWVSFTMGGGDAAAQRRGEKGVELIALSINVPLLCSLWLFALEV